MDIEHLLNTYSLYILTLGSIFLGGLALIALKTKGLDKGAKKLLFSAIVIVTLIPTIVMSASTIYLNVISSSGGPVHWHADIEVWNCGKEVDLKDPKGLSNKIGTPTLHEHNDKRIHLEGVVLKPTDASLGNFFHVIGGSLTRDAFSIPSNEGLLSVRNGANCAGETTSQVQVFAYTTDKKNNYFQQKLEDPASFIIAPFSVVPQGDCIIVEFGFPKEKTDKLCRSYKVAEKIGKVKGEKR